MCVWLCMHSCEHVCARVCMHWRERVCVCVCVHSCVRAPPLLALRALPWRAAWAPREPLATLRSGLARGPGVRAPGPSLWEKLEDTGHVLAEAGTSGF